jgi:hypothetical protein
VGIPREEVEAAARDLESQKAGRPPAPPVALAAPNPDRRRAARRLMRQAATYTVLTAFFFFLSGMQLGGWWIWPAMGFGVSLAMSTIKLVFGDDAPEGDESRQRRPSRRERRRMRREERLADFERKVAIGADALVRVIDEARGAKARLDNDLRPARPERGPRVIVTPPPAQGGRGVRVEARDADGLERDEGDGRGENRRNRGP